jgi:glycine dehydrogenase subunit 1
MGDYLPHTDEDVAQMLAFLGLSSPEQLFAAVPQALRVAGRLALPEGLPEPDVFALAKGRAGANAAAGLVCFAGAGAYDHEVPPVVRALAGRSEFVTAYTPYQAEVAQGGLQAIFEFQTMVSRLFGLPITNASLYDGASAVVEAVNLAVGATGSQGVLVSSGVHPHWRRVLATFAAGTGHRLVEVPLVAGRTDWSAAGDRDGVGALVAGYPNYLGCLEDLAAARARADELGALLVVAADPVMAGILKSPGAWGADVAVGEGQAFGTPLSFGGPYLGLFSCAAAHVRRLPGRLVGETVDAEGRTAYVTTLRTREQDIRREKATSNVCTNQTLMALTAAVQLGWLGTAGLVEVATRCARAGRYCREALLALDGVEPLTGDAKTLREFALGLPLEAPLLVERLAEEGFLAGVALGGLVGEAGDPSLSAAEAGRGLLVALTERRTRKEIDRFVAAFDKALR